MIRLKCIRERQIRLVAADCKSVLNKVGIGGSNPFSRTVQVYCLMASKFDFQSKSVSSNLTTCS